MSSTVSPSMGDSYRIVEILKRHVFPTEHSGPEMGIEIGCCRGETSAKLLAAFPRLNLYMIDPWREWPSGSRYSLTGDSCALMSQTEHDDNFKLAIAATDRFYLRRTILKLTSEVAALRLAGRMFDFVFIDGDHSYEAVRHDIATWWPKIRSGGVLAGHDHGHPRNARGLFGVDRAVNEFCHDTGLTFETTGSCWSIVKPSEVKPEAAAE